MQSYRPYTIIVHVAQRVQRLLSVIDRARIGARVRARVRFKVSYLIRNEYEVSSDVIRISCHIQCYLNLSALISSCSPHYAFQIWDKEKASTVKDVGHEGRGIW